MTTILVTEDNEMFSDSMMTQGDYIDNITTDKIEDLNGYIVGAAGRYTSCLAFKDWFYSLLETRQAMEEHPLANMALPDIFTDENFNALVLDPDGDLWFYETGELAFKVDKPYAIGTGAVYAMSAMDGGADGETAMNVAIKRDVYSGGDIQKMSLDTIAPEALTYEDAKDMSKDELINYVFGNREEEEITEEEEDFESDETDD